MDKLRSGTAKLLFFVLCLLLLLLLIFLSAEFGNEDRHGDHDDHNNVEVHEKKTSVFGSLLNRMFPHSAASTSFPAPSSSSYWNKVKSLINRMQAHFFPPNLDFRGSEEVEAYGGGGGGGTGEKVKEAVVKSFGESKATLEDSAKSAAKLAGQTLHKTAEKVLKKSFSDEEEDHTPQDEL